MVIPWFLRPLRSASPRVSYAFALALAGCGSGQRPPVAGLVINEVVAKNEGVWVDEEGETDDYIELFNGSKERVHLGDYLLSDVSGNYPLPSLELAPGEVVLLWADGSPAQGTTHLPFKVDADGETLSLSHISGAALDSVDVPALLEHRSYQRIPDGGRTLVDCGWATPGRSNGTACGPSTSKVNLDDVTFAPYTWPAPWPAPAGPLVLSELGLHPAEFIEVRNISNATVALDGFEVRLAAHRVGSPWPGPDQGSRIAWPTAELEPGGYLQLPITEDDLDGINGDPNFEGVASVWNSSDATIADRVDFMAWPSGSYLAEYPIGSGRLRLCENATPGAPNAACSELQQRELADRERRLLTPADFHELAIGSEELGTESVKFIVDLQAPNEVTFLSASWDLHFLFIRETIDGLPAYDRCDPEGHSEFTQGWYDFSASEYFRVEGRRYLLGTLVRHAGTGLGTVEFAPGDLISGEQMQHAFFSVVARVPDPENWAIRPQMQSQVENVREVEGAVPIIGPNAPYRDVTFQPLSAAVSYGTLSYVTNEEFRSTTLGPHDIVVTDGVPLDIPLIGGIITEALQTPLSHVNVLSRARGTPNMALRDAHTDPRIAPFLGELVRFEVRGSDFTLELADAEEAVLFWEANEPTGVALTPRLDTSVRGVVDLASRSLDDVPVVGGKAAQMAQLGKVELCAGSVSIPPRAFAIPVVHSQEHFIASGAQALLAELEQNAEFRADSSVRDTGLAAVRQKILDHPLDAALHSEVFDAIRERWPDRSIRLRSSSNVEDLAGFNGAGLYLSRGLDVDEVEPSLADAIRDVWASLWRLRAYDERVYYNVDQDHIAMGVLVHPGFPSEKANGVAISRNVLDPTQANRYYFNTQVGEALVTNPAPGIVSEESSFESNGWVTAVYYSHSTFSPNERILSESESSELWCNLHAIHEHFRPLIDPENANPWFAMDIEFKLVGPNRDLVIKQARPYSYGTAAPEGWCDF
jgi:Pyruvate phosphate dikinase, AMP/ATP-binding domain/Lamin Tail Domain